MRIVRLSGLLGCLILTACAFAEVQVIDGKKYECRDGLCYLVEEEGEAAAGNKGGSSSTSGGDAASFLGEPRVAQGYMRAEEFVAFLEGKEVDSLAGHGLWLTLLLVLLGGIAMNLTPCVLPMVPINLMIIGRSGGRGLAYGLGIAMAYGALGVGASVGGLAFGDIQGSPWFNVAVAVVFVGLALALFDVWFLDLSRFRSGSWISNFRSQISEGGAHGMISEGGAHGMISEGGAHGVGTKLWTVLFPFGMGALSAVLAGACVAPVLVSVLLLTGDLVAKGNRLAVLLPFVMGLGMALPWPFAGAGMKVLPKPGRWMKWVNRVFGVIVLGFAVWYGALAWKGFVGGNQNANLRESNESCDSFLKIARPGNLKLDGLKRPVLVDCWATWCKNCAAMDKVMEEARVKEALKAFSVIKLQAEDIAELRKVKGFESIRGLPAFVIFE